MTDHAAFRHLPVVIARVLAGLLVAATVALAARRAHALDPGGTVAGVAVGAASVAAGWAWGAVLSGCFVLAVALSRLRSEEKRAETGNGVEKGDARDAVQVAANGGVFACVALIAAA